MPKLGLKVRQRHTRNVYTSLGCSSNKHAGRLTDAYTYIDKENSL